MAFASSAQAGITIPAGDWTVDIGGNVNGFYSHSTVDVTTHAGSKTELNDTNSVGTGLLPAAFGIGAKTRQNDIDVAFQFSFFTGTSSGSSLASVLPGLQGATSNGAGGGNTLNIRQAFLTFGDASWGTVKVGRDLGIFGSDAILSDMTLLGVGVGGAGIGGSSTLGRIGSGYMYADWVGQIAYTSPNWNGFQVSAAVREPWTNQFVASATTTNSREDMGYEGKVTYDFAANDVTGRVWLSGISQKQNSKSTTTNGAVTQTSTTSGYTSRGVDVGAKVAYQGVQLVGYYYDGRGLDSQNTGAINNLTGAGGLMFLGGEKTKDSGGYVQATFTVPGIGTKLGASWGVNNSKAENGSTFDIENESWMIGAYHPLTKSLNLVAEYVNNEVKDSKSTTHFGKVEVDTFSVGAIMFF